MFKRFLIAVLIFLVVLVVALDRLGAVVGAHVLAKKVQTEESLPNRPSASIGGIPFLTQAISGKYKDVTITAQGVPVNGLDVTTLTAHLHGVHLSLENALRGSVNEVPVDHMDGTAYLAFADANDYLANLATKHNQAPITLSAGSNGKAEVTEQVTAAGQHLTLTGVGSASVRADVVTLAVSGIKLAGGTAKARSGSVSLVAVKPFSVRFPLTGLPFRPVIKSVSIGPNGITASMTAINLVLGRPLHQH